MLVMDLKRRNKLSVALGLACPRAARGWVVSHHFPIYFYNFQDFYKRIFAKRTNKKIYTDKVFRKSFDFFHKANLVSVPIFLQAIIQKSALERFQTNLLRAFCENPFVKILKIVKVDQKTVKVYPEKKTMEIIANKGFLARFSKYT